MAQNHVTSNIVMEMEFKYLNKFKIIISTKKSYKKKILEKNSYKKFPIKRKYFKNVL